MQNTPLDDIKSGPLLKTWKKKKRKKKEKKEEEANNNNINSNYMVSEFLKNGDVKSKRIA